MIKLLLAIISLSLPLLQDKPADIAKKELPKKATCAVCTASGNGHGEEKPAAGLMYKGKAYFFCNGKEVETFKKNPDLYVPLELPMELPSLDLKDQNGKLWDTAALKGRVVLLDYWATWCKPCLALKPKLDKVRAEFSGDGFEVLSISIDEKQETLDRFLAKQKWDNPVLLDTKSTWANLKIVGIPALFLVSDGRVIAEFRGQLDPEELRKDIRAALEKK